jgi:hypothetical protein
MRMIRRSLIVCLALTALSQLATPASARYGVFHVHGLLRSGDSGWVRSPGVATLTRRVEAGRGVTFDVRGLGAGVPGLPRPSVHGCAATSGIDIRYILETAGGDRDITEAVTGSGWTDPDAGPPSWVVRIRVAFRVGARVPTGTELSCRITINRDPVRANLVVV